MREEGRGRGGGASVGEAGGCVLTTTLPLSACGAAQPFRQGIEKLWAKSERETHRLPLSVTGFSVSHSSLTFS